MTEGEIQVQEEFKNLPDFEQRTKKLSVSVVVFKGAYHEEVEGEIKDEHWLCFKTSDKVKHKKLIASYPIHLRRRRFFFKHALVYYCGYFDEVTKDPDKLKYDIPALEGIIGLAKAVTDTDLAKKLAEEVKSGKMLREYIPWVLFFLSNIAWLIFFNQLVDQLSPY